MSRTARTLEILERLIAFPTVSDQSNLELIDWVEALLRNAGFAVTRIWSPDRCKAGIFARIGPDVVGGVCLSAHTDVVPVAGQNWRRPDFALTRDGDRVFGRGTTDMKGFLASALAIAEDAGTRDLAAPLSLSISYDEEIGCVGMQQMMPTLQGLIGQPRLVIVGEPTGMQVAVGHKGKTALRVTCRGQAGHSALAPQFVNAIHVAAGFVQEVRQLQETLAKGVRDAAYGVPYTTLHIGRITGGQALNIVPDRAELEMEFRHIAGVSAASIRAEIDAAADRGCAGFEGARITIEQINAYPGLDVNAEDGVVDWACDLAGGTSPTKVAFGTEAGFFAALGLSAVVVGPGDMARDGHQPDEGLDVSELVACDAMMDRVLAALG